MRKGYFLFLILFGCFIACNILFISHSGVCTGQDLSQFPAYQVPPSFPQYPTLWSHTYLPSSYIPGFDSLTDRARYVYFPWPGFSVFNSYGLSGIEIAYSYIFPFNATYAPYYLFPEWQIPPTVPASLAQWPLYAAPPSLWFTGWGD